VRFATDDRVTRCEALLRPEYGYRAQCSRSATTMIENHWLCTQHAARALRRRVIHLPGGGNFRVSA
jgi:hypothetical protein